MKILVVATKEPWPPVDGGRLALRNTIYALSRSGHDVTLVAPVVGHERDLRQVETGLAGSCRTELVETQLRSPMWSLVKAERSGRPYTIVRHSLASVRARVELVLAAECFDVIHAEQVQAVAQCTETSGSGPPVVLRQQNVESLLWNFAGTFRGPILARFFLREARRLATWEARVMGEVAATVALTKDDAGHLHSMAGHRGRVEVVPVPFPAKLPSWRNSLEGYPAVVFLASSGWRPNIEAARSFVRDWWPHVRRRVSGAKLHVFGVDALTDASDDVTWHGPPDDSAEAFPEGAIVAIPARHATGVPMKGLEAWARGLPIIASPEAASALAATDGEDMLVAVDPESFAAAVRRLADDPELVDRLVAGGRAALRYRHDPETIAGKLTIIYESVVSGRNDGPFVGVSGLGTG